ncbi:hypothetical protein BDZ89DRAFT_621350 [Hymenopellis radicata]|nr:hypothetical protein BDZ89DRAFT_621350 [Hymenopellis radicata]
MSYPCLVSRQDERYREQLSFAGEGLLTARVCHDHFEHVVVVEAEPWVSTEEARAVHSWTQSHTRSRLIQYQSLQVSLVFLYQGLLRLFPNLERECKASQINVAPGDFTFHFWAGPQILPYAQYLGNLPKTLFASRPALETLIRRLTLHSAVFPNINQTVGTVVGVTKGASNPGYLQQVRVRTKDGEVNIDAALVVDCTGSTQGSIKWLPRAGFGSTRHAEQLSLDVLKVSFDPKIRYSTIRCVVTSSLAQRLPVPGGFDNHDGGIFTLVADTLMDSRYLACVKYEGNSVLICCGARGSESLPVDLAGVRDHVAAIHVTHPIPDWFWGFLKMLNEVEDTMTHSSVCVPPSFWTHYENATNLPSNWIAIGDSVARINPVFGQGCPKVLLGVSCLNSLLHAADKASEQQKKTRSLPSDFSCRFFRMQAAKIAPLWDTPKSIDYGFTTTIPIAGETLELGSFRRWFIRQLQLLSTTDQQAGSLLWHGQMMLNSTSIDALHPILLAKILWFAFKNRYFVNSKAV